jgi:hypothetical protein
MTKLQKTNPGYRTALGYLKLDVSLVLGCWSLDVFPL